MIKAVFLDGDGVTINEEKRFGNRLAEDFNIPYEKILPFFKKEFVLCNEGKADLKKEIFKYFADWRWNRPIEDMFDYWFSGTKANEEVLKVADRLRNNGISCFLTTDQEKYRADYILNELGVAKHFDKCFFSCDIGYRKIDVRFFEAILKDTGIPVQETLYWDDDGKNLEVAAKLGIKTELYSGFNDFYEKIKGYDLL